ncbi:LOW QUALITY PROTEIN: hypothetical protein CRUP_002240 [Coryphaenoides rupestris]|nr:LOW QUALITY PROTEIN: hypothetical protein CRUP_002240 [Coryphaenoides rupestris]
MVGLFSHGFLAGYAVWNMVVVYVLAGKNLTATSDLLAQYHALAYPAQSLSYLLLAISTCGRLRQPYLQHHHLHHSYTTTTTTSNITISTTITTSSTTVTTTLCIIITSNSTSITSIINSTTTTSTTTSRLLHVNQVNLAKGSVALRELVTLDPMALASFCESPGKESEILHPWVTVNLVVAVLVGLAWLFISTRPETDYTEGYLMSMEIEPARPEYKTEMTA